MARPNQARLDLGALSNNLGVARELAQQWLHIGDNLNEALRDPRENIIVKTGDVLLLQETPGESFVRYISNVFNFSGSAAASRVNGVTTRSTATGASVVLP